MLNVAPVIVDELVSTSVVARELRIAENTVRVWARRGALPFTRLASECGYIGAQTSRNWGARVAESAR